jgi:predicted metal-dependent hydrolase
MEPEVQRLLLWHAAEEMEHQSVAHDVYAHLFGDHPIDKLYRARALWGAERILIGFGQRVARRLLACEPSLSREDRHEYLRFLAVRPGLGRKVLWRSLRIVRPGFRPWSDRSDLLLITKALSWV